MRVLLVEDEERLADTIARGLRREGMAVDVVYDGQAALTKSAINKYDVIVLDRNLPIVHGDDVCKRLVEQGSLARILMLTAAGSIQDRVTGLNLGADDYLPKPFALKELVARIRALGRRAVTPLPPVLKVGDLILDPARHVAERDGRDLGLTKKEFGVLQVLMAAKGRVVSAEELLEKVWDENTDPFTNVVRVTIMTLRRKLGDPQVVETIPGVGYRIPEEPQEPGEEPSGTGDEAPESSGERPERESKLQAEADRCSEASDPSPAGSEAPGHERF